MKDKVIEANEPHGSLGAVIDEAKKNTASDARAKADFFAAQGLGVIFARAGMDDLAGFGIHDFDAGFVD
ncbi:MAG TPA: hypothetical protein VHN79_03725, partial [Lacunisphaera sp.]|nr:hypothetical protein [Lacunisphaera sp.]